MLGELTGEALVIDDIGDAYRRWLSVDPDTASAVIVAHLPSVPIDERFISDSGSGVLAFRELGTRKGYELVGVDARNAYFVKKEFSDRFPSVGLGIADMWSEHVTYRTFVWQQFDGIMIVQSGADMSDRLKSGDYLWEGVQGGRKTSSFAVFKNRVLGLLERF